MNERNYQSRNKNGKMGVSPKNNSRNFKANYKMNEMQAGGEENRGNHQSWDEKTRKLVTDMAA